MDNEILIPKHVMYLIRKILEEYNLKTHKITEATTPTKPGDNWLSQILNFTISGSTLANESVILNIIAKLAPTEHLYRNFHTIKSVYECEIFFYNNVVSELIKIQTENNVEQLFSPFAKCYQALLRENEESLLLEDMMQLGYKMVNQREPTDYQHASLIMKSLGKLHALSFALRKQKPHVLKTFSSNLTSRFFNDNFCCVIHKLGIRILNKLNNNSAIFRKFQNYVMDPSLVIEKLANLELLGEYAVVVHGDTQTRNVLFKYDESNPRNPTDLCMLDWQLARVGSPALDVSLFMCVSTDKKFRDRHYRELLQVYYNSFSAFLTELGGIPQEAFPIDVFREHLKKFSVHGICLGMLALLSQNFELKNLSNIQAADNNKRLVEALSAISEDNIFFIRMKEVLEDFEKYDYEI